MQIERLISEAKESLIRERSAILAQIKESVEFCKAEENGTSHYLFHIDDRSWYATYFHIYKDTEVLFEKEIKLPRFLEKAVNEIQRNPDGNGGKTAEDFFEEINDVLIEIIADDWKKADGEKLGFPAFITVHDSDYFYDVEKDEVLTEAEALSART